MKKIIATTVIILFASACEKDFEEINVDPNNAVAVATSDLLAAAQRNLVRDLFGMNDEWGFAYIPHVYPIAPPRVEMTIASAKN
jgi:hypothetical protein